MSTRRELRETQRLRQTVRGREMEARAWLQAWPWAKAMAMQVDVDVWRSGQPWAEVWTRKEARAQGEAREQAKAKVNQLEATVNQMEAEDEADMWPDMRMKWIENMSMTMAHDWPEEMSMAQVRAEAAAAAEGLALAGVWGWARGDAHARRESVPAILADPSTIRDILSDHHRSGVAHRLWYNSRETREEYSCITRFIAPITRLPLELLHQIFLVIIDESSGPPLVLMLVCKYWRIIVTSIWGSLNLGTRTPMNIVTTKLARNQRFLDIVVDTDSDRRLFTLSHHAFGAIFAAIEASSRWRSLVIKSFRCPNTTMSRFKTFKVKSACKASPLLDGLLHILGTTVGSELTTVEINSPNVISFLAPAYPLIFHSIKVLSLDTPGIPNPVDLLPHLHQLETFTASHISFPIYHNDVNLPFVHTLHHLRLTAVSIQWMSGRTFHVLEHCIIIFPLHRQVLHTFSITLPNCRHLTFQGYPLEILGGVSAHKLTQLSVISSGSFNRRGSRQLVWLSRQVLGESQFRPQILHISIEATNQAWMFALSFMSDLEELVIHNARPSSLRAKILQLLVAQPVDASNLGATSSPGEFRAPLCPSLRRLGLKYDRWLRPTEQFDFIPVFVSIIRSRQHSNCSLSSFRIWTTRGEKVPLELIGRSGLSVKGFGRLAKESGIKGSLLSYGVDISSPAAPGESFLSGFGTEPRVMPL